METCSIGNSEIKYRTKKQEVLGKFTQDLVREFHNYDPAFQMIIELLIRDADPYSIIENLIKDRKHLCDDLLDALRHNAHPKPMIITPKSAD